MSRTLGLLGRLALFGLVMMSGFIGILVLAGRGIDASPFVALWLGVLGIAAGGGTILRRQSVTHEKLDHIDHALNGAMETKIRRIVGHEFIVMSDRLDRSIKDTVESAVDSALARRLGK